MNRSTFVLILACLLVLCSACSNFAGSYSGEENPSIPTVEITSSAGGDTSLPFVPGAPETGGGEDAGGNTAPILIDNEVDDSPANEPSGDLEDVEVQELEVQTLRLATQYGIFEDVKVRLVVSPRIRNLDFFADSVVFTTQTSQEFLGAIANTLSFNFGTMESSFSPMEGNIFGAATGMVTGAYVNGMASGSVMIELDNGLKFDSTTSDHSFYFKPTQGISLPLGPDAVLTLEITDAYVDQMIQSVSGTCSTSVPCVWTDNPSHSGELRKGD